MIERIYSYFVVAYVAFKHLISHDNKYIIMLSYSKWLLFYYLICRCQAIYNYSRGMLNVALITVREYARRKNNCLNLARNCTSNGWLSAIKRTKMEVIVREWFMPNWDKISWMFLPISDTLWMRFVNLLIFVIKWIID